MSDEENRELAEQLAELREDVRIIRRCLVFIVWVIALSIIIPLVVAIFAYGVTRNWGPVLAIPLVVIIAALVVSHFSPRPAGLDSEETHSH